MLINLIRCIKHFCTVGRLSGDIIYSMDQDDVVVFGIIIVFNDLIVETFYQCIIGQFAFSQFHKKMLSSALRFLLERKFHVHQIFSYCSGKGFAENFKVFEHFFLRKRKKSFFQFGFFILFSVNVTSADAGERTVLGSELFLDFRNFFFVHLYMSSSIPENMFSKPISHL